MQNWRDTCVVDGGKTGVGSRDEGKHTGRNDLLFVEKMTNDLQSHPRSLKMARMDKPYDTSY